MNVIAWMLLACSVVVVVDALRGRKSRTVREQTKAWAIAGLAVFLTVSRFRAGDSLGNEGPGVYAAPFALAAAWLAVAVYWGRRKKSPMPKALFYVGLIGSIALPSVVRGLLA